MFLLAKFGKNWSVVSVEIDTCIYIQQLWLYLNVGRPLGHNLKKNPKNPKQDPFFPSLIKIGPVVLEDMSKYESLQTHNG